MARVTRPSRTRNAPARGAARKSRRPTTSPAPSTAVVARPRRARRTPPTRQATPPAAETAPAAQRKTLREAPRPSAGSHDPGDAGGPKERGGHFAVSSPATKLSALDFLREPADGDEQALQKGERAGRAAGDEHVDGKDLVEPAADDLVLVEHSTEWAGSDGDDELRLRHGCIGLRERQLHHPHDRARHHEQVGVARGGGEEEPEPVQVVMGGKQETDLRLADGARARIDRPDVQAPAEEPVDIAGEPRGEAILLRVQARPLAPLTCHHLEWGSASQDGRARWQRARTPRSPRRRRGRRAGTSHRPCRRRRPTRAPGPPAARRRSGSSRRAGGRARW